VTEWPKNPELRVAGDSSLEPVGPLNVFNEKLHTAEAINQAHLTKTTYDKHAQPKPGPIVIVDHRPETLPVIPIGAGRRPPVNASRYMIVAPKGAARPITGVPAAAVSPHHFTKR